MEKWFGHCCGTILGAHVSDCKQTNRRHELLLIMELISNYVEPLADVRVCHIQRGVKNGKVFGFFLYCSSPIRKELRVTHGF